MIPNGTRFIGIAPEVDLTERGSALLNKRTEPYTIDDIRGYKVFTALLTQSGGDNALLISEGTLTIGVTYVITSSFTGDDFSNVGGPKITFGDEWIGTYFIATGTTPANWTNETEFEYNTGAPIVNVLENTIGNIWFTYSGEGAYLITSNALFTENKTILFASSMNNGNDTNNHTATVYTSAPNELTFASWGNTGDNQLELDNSIPLPIEIRVYN